MRVYQEQCPRASSSDKSATSFRHISLLPALKQIRSTQCRVCTAEMVRRHFVGRIAGSRMLARGFPVEPHQFPDVNGEHLSFPSLLMLMILQHEMGVLLFGLPEEETFNKLNEQNSDDYVGLKELCM